MTQIRALQAREFKSFGSDEQRNLNEGSNSSQHFFRWCACSDTKTSTLIELQILLNSPSSWKSYHHRRIVDIITNFQYRVIYACILVKLSNINVQVLIQQIKTIGQKLKISIFGLSGYVQVIFLVVGVFLGGRILQLSQNVARGEHERFTMNQ